MCYLPFRADISEDELSRLRAKYRHVLVNSQDNADNANDYIRAHCQLYPARDRPQSFPPWPRKKQRLIADRKYVLALYETEKDLELILDAWLKIMREHETYYLIVWPEGHPHANTGREYRNGCHLQVGKSTGFRPGASHCCCPGSLHSARPPRGPTSIRPQTVLWLLIPLWARVPAGI